MMIDKSILSRHYEVCMLEVLILYFGKLDAEAVELQYKNA